MMIENENPDLAEALEAAAGAIGRLDQALATHPLLPAFLYRARLDAVRRQAAVDGRMIDPWHLAAVLQGLRLRMDHALRIVDRGALFEAARHALVLHQWITAPDFDQEGEIRRATAALERPPTSRSALLTAARGLRAWLEQAGARAPMRAALIRHWTGTGLLRAPVPLTGADALRAGTTWTEAAWVPAFLMALAGEATDSLRLLTDMERAWHAARQAGAGQRRTSRAALAIDIMAAAPLVSASSLAAGLGMAVTNATALLDRFCADGIAIEVTHRCKRRLFGLAGLAPLRDGVASPRRPLPGRGRGRPPLRREEAPVAPPVPLPPQTRIDRPDFHYDEVEQAIAALDATVRQTRHILATLIDRPDGPHRRVGATPDPAARIVRA